MRSKEWHVSSARADWLIAVCHLNLDVTLIAHTVKLSGSTDFGVWAPACGNKTSLNWATTSTQKLIVMIIIIVIILSASFRNELCNVGLEALKHAVNGRAVYVTLTVKLAPERRRERDGREWRERKKR